MASFRLLKKFDLKLVAICIFIIGIMMIVPSLNIIFSNAYMDEGKVTLNERIVILNTIGHLVWT